MSLYNYATLDWWKFGITEGILTENGVEFSSEETGEFASLLNLEVCTVATDSRFQMDFVKEFIL